jgi:hypothetical protein
MTPVAATGVIAVKEVLPVSGKVVPAVAPGAATAATAAAVAGEI